MAKAILMSIRPQYVAQILKGNKTIEVRKKFPKDYVGWVYIYCTKHKLSTAKYGYLNDIDYNYAKKIGLEKEILNGKVVARFWCDKVEHFEFETVSRDIDGYWWDNGDMVDKKLLKQSCLTYDEFYDYIKCGEGYAIHISKLEVFDNLLMLTMFRKPEFNKNIYDNNGNRLSLLERLRKYSIGKAPQSWCYIYE